MRWRVLLLLSLVANLVLATGWWLAHRREARLYRQAIESPPPGPTQVRTNVIVRRQFFSWEELESNDYPTYIANLRDIGCPEQTIRDIIIADVNALYARKRSTEVLTPEQQWWRSEPDTNVLQVAAAKIRELDRERRALLSSLLGPSWEGGDLVSLPRPSHPSVALDGPVLGELTTEVKQAVQEIAARSQERIQTYTLEQQRTGQPVDSAELARLWQQTRQELSAVLAPAQLEEFLLRHSQTATNLRAAFGQLKYFNPTPEEFRAVFRATEALDQQLAGLGSATDPNSSLLRTALERQREDALRLALGAERFEQYRLLQDEAYRDAYAAAQGANAPEATDALYAISQAAAAEQARLRANTNLSPEQLAFELKKAELEQLKATAQALGQEWSIDPPPQPPKPQPKKLHVLAPGENLNVLARLYGVNPDALRAANPNLDLDKLKAGDSVSVPLSLLPP